MLQNIRTVDLEVSQEEHASNSSEFRRQDLAHVIIYFILDRED